MKQNKHTPLQQQAEDKNEKKSKSIISFWNSIKSNKIFHISLLIVVSFVFYMNYDAIFDKKLDMNGDNIQYYSLGQSLHNGTGYSDIMGFEVKPHTHFPPGYPAFISVLMNFSKGNSFLPIKKANGFLLFVSIIFMFYVMKKVSANNVVVAFCAAILFCVQKDLLRWSTIMMSEMLYLSLTMVAISILLHLAKKQSLKELSKWDYAAATVFALSIAYIYFVRTMGISLIVGMLGWLACMALWQGYKIFRLKKEQPDACTPHRNKIIYYACLMALIVVPFIVAKCAWGARNQSIGHVQTDYISDFKKKGGKGEVMTTWSDWTDRIYNNAKNYLTKMIPETVLTKQFEKNDPVSGEDILVGFLIFALVMIGFWHTGWSGFLLFSYLAVTFGVLLFWPEQYTSVRYYVTVIPFILFFFINGILNVLSFFLGKIKDNRFKEHSHQVASLAVALTCFLWLIPSQKEAQATYRDLARLPYKKIVADKNCLNFYEALDWCKTNLPDSTRMVCRKPELFYMYSGFKKSVSFPYYASEDSIINYLNKVKATHIILDNWFKHAYTTLYPAIKKHPENFKAIHTIGKIDTAEKINPAYIVEYNPDWGYKGELINGKKEGLGSYFYQDGRKYVGNFKNDLFDGEGTLLDKNGHTQFQGTWKEGNYDVGKGYAIYDSKKYEGEFHNGKPNGYGVYSDTLGNVIAKGIWKNGTLIQMQ